MTWSVCTLLLATVALMASQASVPAGPDSAQGRAATRTLTRFVCAKCSETGLLSSRGLYLSRAAVHSHIAASKPCFSAKMGFREIQVDARTSDVMTGAGGTAGPAPDVRHQPEGTVVVFRGYIPCINRVCYQGLHAGSVGVETAGWYA